MEMLERQLNMSVEFSRGTWGLEMRLEVIGMQVGIKATVFIQSLSSEHSGERKRSHPREDPAKGMEKESQVG